MSRLADPLRQERIRRWGTNKCMGNGGCSRHEHHGTHCVTISVIAKMEDPDAASPIAAQLDSIGKQLAALARDR